LVSWVTDMPARRPRVGKYALLTGQLMMLIDTDM